ncbi:hypothetical protein ACVBIO_15910 [Shewanella sp. 0m-8]
MSSISGVVNSTSINVGAKITSNVAADSATQQATASHVPDIAANAASASALAKPLPNTGASTTVVLSTAAQDKLITEQGVAKANSSAADAKAVKAEADEDGDFESFVFGALGLDHPEEIDENGDPSYSAGQYVKAAATVGGMIAMFI